MPYSGFIEERGIRCIRLAHSKEAENWTQLKDLDGALETLKSEDVDIRTAVMESPGCRFFVIADPDGNDLTIHQHK